MEEAAWAVEVLREVGAPVAVTMCIGPKGDMHDVTPGECAVKLARAGKVALCPDKVGSSVAAWEVQKMCIILSEK